MAEPFSRLGLSSIKTKQRAAQARSARIEQATAKQPERGDARDRSRGASQPEKNMERAWTS
jgi:hypothetical protein